MDQIPLRRPQFFFTTAPMPCPYLPDRLERKVVTELIGPDAEALHEALSRAGFRRSHSIAYAPACPGCSACLPVRISVDGFTWKKTFRRTMKANTDLSGAWAPAAATTEQFRLFSRYQQSRHAGGDMAMMGYFEYRSMVEDSPIDTAVAEFRTPDDELWAVALVDRLADGLSAVYSFFEPGHDSRSLGTYMVLWMVTECQRLGLPHLYLGYWIPNSPKMAYKARFQPLEVFGAGGWTRPGEPGYPNEAAKACGAGATGPRNDTDPGTGA